jgi:hypothetical protein
VPPLELLRQFVCPYCAISGCSDISFVVKRFKSSKVILMSLCANSSALQLKTQPFQERIFSFPASSGDSFSPTVCNHF